MAEDKQRLDPRRVLAAAGRYLRSAVAIQDTVMAAPEARALTTARGRTTRAAELAKQPDAHDTGIAYNLTLAAAVTRIRPHLRAVRKCLCSELRLSPSVALSVLWVVYERLDDDDERAYEDLLLALEERGVDRRRLANAAPGSRLGTASLRRERVRKALSQARKGRRGRND